jgi:hypothetical protein
MSEPGAMPKITEEALKAFRNTELMYLDSEGNYQWSRLAIDFAALCYITGPASHEPAIRI